MLRAAVHLMGLVFLCGCVPKFGESAKSWDGTYNWNGTNFYTGTILEIRGNDFILKKWVHSPIDAPCYEPCIISNGEIIFVEDTLSLKHEDSKMVEETLRRIINRGKTYLVNESFYQKNYPIDKSELENHFRKNEKNH